jgi:hypothetical protein
MTSGFSTVWKTIFHAVKTAPEFFHAMENPGKNRLTPPANLSRLL